MKKYIFVLLIVVVVVLGGCTDTMPTDMVGPSASPTITIVPEPTAEPLPLVMEIAPLDIPVPYNDDLIIKEGDINTVIINEFVEDYCDFNHANLAMPAYVWHINSDVNKKMDSIVIEFDLYSVCELEHLYGLDIGYQIGLIDATPLELSRDDGYPSITYDLNRYIQQPIHMIDLKKFAQIDGQKIKITIPFEHFKTAAKDIIFIPYQGASYGNLNIYAQGYDIADLDAKTLTSEEYTPYVNSVLPYIDEDNNFFKAYDPGKFMEQTCGHFYEVLVYKSFLNSDGSYNMFLSEIDLGEWQSEVTCDYGIVPEYLFYPLIYGHDEYDVTNELVRFVFNNMRDETTGLISGIWDNRSGKKVAVDRPSANSPLFLLFFDYLSNEEKIKMLQAIIDYEVYSINGKYYYLPNGYENSRALIKLADLTNVAVTVDVFSDQKFPSGISAVLVEMLDQGAIDIKEAAIYTEAIANSLELIMQAQENNPTHLPDSAIYVTFNENGEYDFENTTGEFSIDNYYYQTILNSSHDRWYTSLFIDEANEELRLRSNKKSIEECMYQLNIMRNCNAIKLYEYKVHRNIYDFIIVQDEQTRFAPRYDLITGDPIFNNGSAACPFLDTYNRFGSPKEFINYHAILSEFADYALVDEMNALMGDYAYKIGIQDYYYFNYNVENDAKKMNISVNKDFLCLRYAASHTGIHSSDYSNGYPVTIHLGAFGWFQTTGERLKNSYIRFIQNGGRVPSSYEIPQKYTEIIDELSCDTYH